MNWKAFCKVFCKKLWIKNNTRNIRRLVDDSFVPLSQRPSVIYYRLTDFCTLFLRRKIFFPSFLLHSVIITSTVKWFLRGFTVQPWPQKTWIVTSNGSEEPQYTIHTTGGQKMYVFSLWTSESLWKYWWCTGCPRAIFFFLIWLWKKEMFNLEYIWR